MAMYKNFIKVRSGKDIFISAGIVITGSVLIALPTAESVNILGFLMIFAGILLGIFLKTGWKDEQDGGRYDKFEIYLDKSKVKKISKSLPINICPAMIKSNGNGTGLRLDIYYNKDNGKTYVQLFEYVPFHYEPCTEMYEHEYRNIAEIVK